MLTYFLLIIGFIIIIKGADLLVDGASSIAKKLNVSDLVIGLTVVAFGTSAPELFVNVFASIQGNSEIAIGNILGSNIANILLILGVAAIIFPLSVQSTTVWKEIPFSLLAALILGVLVNDHLIDHKENSELTRGDGLVLIGFFIIFMYYIFSIAKKSENKTIGDLKQLSNFRSVSYILLGLTGLVLGGTWIVNGAIEIAGKFGVSEYLIGLTVVAVGTSLPELATSAVAAYKKNTDIAIGNVVGSNIFNIFWVLGISAVIKPLPFKPAGNSDIAMTVFASVLLFAVLFVGKKQLLEKWQGVLFLLLYAGYSVFLIMRG
ncbi:MAG: calcium/sodium antiporter [Saprospiraceae bacterium]|jgi:cation:H+ antiporter|nr:calcium/sodium antiporter [Saprospiraceae bacterium]MBK6816456.1 calcium/sodium antiporter [Saprospiraceae bacterium]MBK7370981.1 calcium/sodium antiporter [Saprospiraceae bacterium]MBK7436519.1 calcium/sodium antiporter [Saprospiraceae bacterium]MBK8514648.1 calcium/sodium antiporter [Saprospiraceae bacterium]